MNGETLGERAAKQALGGSVEENRHQVSMTEESRVLLAATLRQEMGDAFARGLKEAMTSDNARHFMRAMLTEAQVIAREKSDQFAGSIVRAGARKLLLFVVLGSVVYAFGGWSALAGLGKFLMAKD